MLYTFLSLRLPPSLSLSTDCGLQLITGVTVHSHLVSHVGCFSGK